MNAALRTQVPATEQTEAVAIVEDILQLREAEAFAELQSERFLDAALRRRGDETYRRSLAAQHRDARAASVNLRRDVQERLTRWSQTYRPALWR